MQVLAILQRADVNIASMHVARPSTQQGLSQVTLSGGQPSSQQPVPMALCFMALDDDVPTTALSSLKTLSFLHDVAKIQLQ